MTLLYEFDMYFDDPNQTIEAGKSSRLGCLIELNLTSFHRKNTEETGRNKFITNLSSVRVHSLVAQIRFNLQLQTKNETNFKVSICLTKS